MFFKSYQLSVKLFWEKVDIWTFLSAGDGSSKKNRYTEILGVSSCYCVRQKLKPEKNSSLAITGTILMG